MDLKGFGVVLWVSGFFAVNECFELFQQFLCHRWIWLHFLDNSVGGTELWTSISWKKTYLCANRWVLLRLRGGFFLRPEDGDFSILKILLCLRIYHRLLGSVTFGLGLWFPVADVMVSFCFRWFISFHRGLGSNWEFWSSSEAPLKISFWREIIRLKTYSVW
jgi:hypothetical protein